MGVDAGTISSSIRIKLDTLEADIKSAGLAFDNLGDEFTRAANQYSTAGGKKYKAALERIANESRNVDKAVKSGALTQQDAINRLIKLRKEELAILQNKAVKEGQSSAESVKAINKTRDALEKLEEQQKLLASEKSGSMLSMFQKMQAVMQGPVAAFQLVRGAISKVVDVTGKAIQSAVDAQEIYSKYKVVFDGTGSAADEMANRFAKSFDLSGASAKEMLSNTGNLLQGFGATKQKSLELSEKVNILAGDLASFTNNQGGARVASEALTKALLGEREQAKTLGLAILESDVQARLAQKGQAGLEGQALKLAKAEATLELMTEQAKNSIGDYARTQDSASNRMKAASESTKELGIQFGTFLTPLVALGAKAWGTMSKAMAEVLKKYNELREGQKADVLDNDSLEKKILFLKEERKQIEKNLQIGKEKAKQYGYDYTAQEAQAKAQIKLNEEGIKAAEHQITIRDDAAKKAASDADKAAKDKEEQLALDERIAEQYKKSREIVINTLDNQKTEYQKIQEQIDTLQKTPWQKGELETERLAAVEALRKKLDELSITERNNRLKDSDSARDAAKKKLEDNQALVNSIYALGDAQETSIEKDKKAAIEKIKNAGFIKEQQDELIAKVEEYYSTLEDKEASEKFLKNITEAVGTGIDLMGAFFDLMNVLNGKLQDQEEARLKKETKLLENELNTRQEKEAEFLEEKQERDQEALDSRYESLLENLDKELQAELFSRGLVGAATIEQYQKELDAAIATGDAIKIKEAQDALDKATVEKQYSDKRIALQAAEDAEKKALDEQQAKDKKELEEKQAKEKEKLAENQARKEAKINYKYQLANWKMQLAMATAMAGQAILNAASTPPWSLTKTVAAGALGTLNVATVAGAKPEAPSFAKGGSFIVPQGYGNDSYPMAWAQSGERVTIETPEQQKRNSGTTIVIQGNIYGGKAGLRELSRELSGVDNLEERRRGVKK